MSKHSKVNLTRLRDIGWEHWDPIGLVGIDGDIADEYDSYLLKAASMIRSGEPDDAVIGYLLRTETETIGIDTREDAPSRAKATVEAIRADKKLWSDR
jgi:hypothetical protein